MKKINTDLLKEVATVGLDLGKQAFQVHCADGRGRKLLNAKLRRDQVERFFGAVPHCRVAMETCGGANHWGRRLQAMGHEVKLIPAQYVKPFVKSNKTDAADAEAICEAAQRPQMRFAAVKTQETQALLSLHRTRQLLVKQRTQLINSLRGQCAEFGVIAPRSREGVSRLIAVVHDEADDRLPSLAREAFATFVELLERVGTEVERLERAIVAWHRASEMSRRLEAIPGVGPLTATALTVALGDGAQYHNGRQFAASLGLVPRQEGTGGKTRLGRISKRGDRYLRTNLIHGARSSISWRLRRDGPGAPALRERVESKSVNAVAVAQANRTARVAWAMVRRNEVYRAGQQFERDEAPMQAA